MSFNTAQEVLSYEIVGEAVCRGIISILNNRVTYRLNQSKSYDWTDPEEWVRAYTIAWLVILKDYPTNRIRTEVTVPRRTPSDLADIVVYSDDECKTPYLVVENKASGQTPTQRNQGVEQLFGNANSLRAPLGLYDEGKFSLFFDVANFSSGERNLNRRGDRSVVPQQYGNVPEYAHIAGEVNDVQPVDTPTLSSRIRRAHCIIWAGGRRDPLLAFDEWSKLLFAKVVDERTTPTGCPRRFQFGTHETVAAVANRVHRLFSEASRNDPSLFPTNSRIELSEGKMADVVRCLQDLSFTRTDVDSIGRAFEEFFGSVFRGELGQYFTMRQLTRFMVAVLDVSITDYVLDPTAGSGGFLLEMLFQVWHHISTQFEGQPPELRDRLKTDFAVGHVYGIEIHEILARVCKINLLLHHDGHTNIEGNRSCLDATFTNSRLNNPEVSFSKIVGNPPFGDEVKSNDEDHLGTNDLSNFEIANGRKKVASEQIILERCIQWLEPGGRFGLIIPDGLLNNQGNPSNCPQTRCMLARRGRIEAIVSLPDHAFRKSGAQNKTSILFFRKFTSDEQRAFDRAYSQLQENGVGGVVDLQIDSKGFISRAIIDAGLNYKTFLAEASSVGYTPSGAVSPLNDLYRSDLGGSIGADQEGTILSEWRKFLVNPDTYNRATKPDCMVLSFDILWDAHNSHRLDPKYHLFMHEAQNTLPQGWIRDTIGNLMRRRELPKNDFILDQEYTVMTLSQTGEICCRSAGKGNNPPMWVGDYFVTVSPGDWFAAHAGDVVYSSIDLWKGCISVVPAGFNGVLVTKEFPIYEITDSRLLPEFVQILLRSRYYRRAFRAITTGHSNRRRTQVLDFESIEIAFPPTAEEQRRLISGIASARTGINRASEVFRREILIFNGLIDGCGVEEVQDNCDEEETEAL